MCNSHPQTGGYGCTLNNKIRSMKVPGGLKVTGYKGTDHKDRKYGPYYGPVILNTVDAPGTWKSYKIEVVQNNKARRRGFYKIHKAKYVEGMKNYTNKMVKNMMNE